MRYQMDSVEAYGYVLMHMYPDPSPRWFVFHPVQRRLKRILFRDDGIGDLYHRWTHGRRQTHIGSHVFELY
ncbi:hypothetical protein Bca4012_069550 [Brassica carinata]|uniref:Uncharacterized protein n=1 Tax=Brassica carinata TaxID=52824 RepID=A0A8X7U6Y3_BRACI|nr:hypothetical protein Bca52824_062079 [Brassica carinata]